MPRITKEEAEQTRLRILEAARHTFHERGVSATGLEHIARAAGVTRGAIYWHFQDKEDLFKAMREQVMLPHIDRVDDLLLEPDDAPALDRLQRFLEQLVQAWTGNEALRQVLEIMVFKCEYVGPMSGDLEAHIAHHLDLVAKLERIHLQAERHGELREGLSPRMAALETACFVGGLARITLLQPRCSSLCSDLRSVIAAHVGGRRRRG